MKTWLALCVLALGVAVTAAIACSDAPNEQPCKNVPPGGCPLSHGFACDDPTCEAAYACEPGGAWRFDHACPPRDAGPDALLDAPAAPPPRDAAIDVPPGAFGGPGCADLEPPDCPLGLALSCSGCCGCEDLFVCSDGGWAAWGACFDGGLVPGR
jgi:hypothetical protein